jgi:putative ABC transport system substrate-binding protein
MVDRILRGTKPSAIPVEQSRSEIFINLRTARALALTIPSSLLSRADERIE